MSFGLSLHRQTIRVPNHPDGDEMTRENKKQFINNQKDLENVSILQIVSEQQQAKQWLQQVVRTCRNDRNDDNTPTGGDNAGELHRKALGHRSRAARDSTHDGTCHARLETGEDRRSRHLQDRLEDQGSGIG